MYCDQALFMYDMYNKYIIPTVCVYNNEYAPAEANDRMDSCSVEEVCLVLDGCQSHCLLCSAGNVPLDYTDPVLRGGGGGGGRKRREKGEGEQEEKGREVRNKGRVSKRCINSTQR